MNAAQKRFYLIITDLPRVNGCAVLLPAEMVERQTVFVSRRAYYSHMTHITQHSAAQRSTATSG